MNPHHRAFVVITLLIACTRAAWSGNGEPAAANPSIDDLLAATESTKNPADRRRLTSDLVEHCASPEGGRPLGLSHPQVDRLVRLLHDPEPWVRGNVAACLGFDGPAAGEALPALQEAQRTTPLIDYPDFPGLRQPTQPRDLILTAIRRVEGAIPVHNAASAASPRK